MSPILDRCGRGHGIAYFMISPSVIGNYNSIIVQQYKTIFIHCTTVQGVASRYKLKMFKVYFPHFIIYKAFLAFLLISNKNNFIVLTYAIQSPDYYLKYRIKVFKLIYKNGKQPRS